MKLNVKLTSDELQDVLDTIKDVAVEEGYDFVDEDDEEFGSMIRIVDAALAAMGIEIVEDDDDDWDAYDDDGEWEDAEDNAPWYGDEDEDEEEEEEDEEESEPEGKHIPWHEADRLMDFAAAIGCFCSGKRPGEVTAEFVEGINNFAREMFSKFCDVEGITHVDEEEDE